MSTLSSESSSGGTWFLSLPVYTCRMGSPSGLPRKAKTLGQARDSIGGPEPIKFQAASYTTTTVGSIPGLDLACTPTT